MFSRFRPSVLGRGWGYYIFPGKQIYWLERALITTDCKQFSARLGLKNAFSKLSGAKFQFSDQHSLTSGEKGCSYKSSKQKEAEANLPEGRS